MKILLNNPEGFDIYELAMLAGDCGFDGVQLYLNPALAAEPDSLEGWWGHLEEQGLELAVHLPPAPDPAVLQALGRIARPHTPVISHYPEDHFIPESGQPAWEFAPFGIRTEAYARWLERCLRAGATPVLDLPRLFRDSGESDARRFADRLFTDLAGRLYILHLIDCETPGQERPDWCELGRGRVGRYLEQAVFPLPELAVLEYESLIQSVNSLPWLRRLAREVGG